MKGARHKAREIALQALYEMDSLEKWDKGATAMLGDDMFGVHMRFVGRQNAQSGAPTYLYHFTRVPPSSKQTIGAFHAAEISFVFDSHLRGMKLTEGDRKLTKRMVSYWANFARTGNPNHSGLPQWPAFDAGKRSTMIFDSTCAVKDDPDGEEMKALDGSMKWT